jgi:hypothetical protein
MTISRRKLLLAIGGFAGTVGIGYTGARSVARKGIVNGRLVVGYEKDNDTIVDQTYILREYTDPDGPPDREIHSAYRQEFPAESPMTVSWSLNRRLNQEFDEVSYHLSHSCPDNNCHTPGVSRRDFNGARLGEKVRLLYFDVNAVVIPW